jgi:hypothetical protein
MTTTFQLNTLEIAGFGLLIVVLIVVAEWSIWRDQRRRDRGRS